MGLVDPAVRDPASDRRYRTAACGAAQTRASPDADLPPERDHLMVRPTVLIVDDHGDFRTAARELLDAEGFDVVGEANNGASAVREVARLRPAIVLLDIQLPDLDGFAVADQIAARPEPPIVVLISSRDALVYGDRVETTPARGFIPKTLLSGSSLAELLARHP